MSDRYRSLPLDESALLGRTGTRFLDFTKTGLEHLRGSTFKINRYQTKTSPFETFPDFNHRDQLGIMFVETK